LRLGSSQVVTPPNRVLNCGCLTPSGKALAICAISIAAAAMPTLAIKSRCRGGVWGKTGAGYEELCPDTLEAEL
jgi:hypothetical protein